MCDSVPPPPPPLPPPLCGAGTHRNTNGGCTDCETGYFQPSADFDGEDCHKCGDVAPYVGAYYQASTGQTACDACVYPIPAGLIHSCAASVTCDHKTGECAPAAFTTTASAPICRAQRAAGVDACDLAEACIVDKVSCANDIRDIMSVSYSGGWGCATQAANHMPACWSTLHKSTTETSWTASLPTPGTATCAGRDVKAASRVKYWFARKSAASDTGAASAAFDCPTFVRGSHLADWFTGSLTTLGDSGILAAGSPCVALLSHSLALRVCPPSAPHATPPPSTSPSPAPCIHPPVARACPPHCDPTTHALTPRRYCAPFPPSAIPQI